VTLSDLRLSYHDLKWS